MKTCTKCNETKDLDAFYKKTALRLKAVCKKCCNRYSADRWKKRKLKAIEYKGGKCISCGYNKYPDVLEFHHRDPSEKEFEWNKLRKRNWESVLKELDKCDMLCANCHRERHHEIFSLNKK
jgi:hypothetical protein